MVPEEICRILEAEFGDAIPATHLAGAHPHALVSAQRWPEVARFLRDDDRLRFDFLRSITGLDLLADNKLAAVYDLLALPPVDADRVMTGAHEFAVRIEVDRDDPYVPSVADVWPAADWHEREAFDLLGIVFDGHPDLSRILCPEDWVGHPLRKDYEFPTEYHAIPATTEYELTNPRH